MSRDPSNTPGARRPSPADGSTLQRRLGREFTTMRHMVGLYCKAHHGPGDNGPCTACQAFLDYAARRLDKCPYGEDKPTCANCPVHCYKQAPREFAREVMRYAGPRMMIHHPWLALMHLLDKRRKVAHPMDIRRG